MGRTLFPAVFDFCGPFNPKSAIQNCKIPEPENLRQKQRTGVSAPHLSVDMGNRIEQKEQPGSQKDHQRHFSSRLAIDLGHQV